MKNSLHLTRRQSSKMIAKSSHEPNTFYCLEEIVDQVATDFYFQQDYVAIALDSFLKLIDDDMSTTPEGLSTWSDSTATVVPD